MKIPFYGRLLLLSAFFTVGCTSILAYKHKILVNTYPVPSKIYRDGKELGTTPCYVKVNRKSKSPLIIKREGYETKEIPLTPQFNFFIFTNFFFNYGIGIPIDIITGTHKGFKEKKIVTSITPIEETKQSYKVNSFIPVENSDEYNFYNLKSKLRINDFKNKELKKGLKNLMFGATTNSNFLCQYIIKDTTVQVQIVSIFYKQYSFYRKSGGTSFLIHEQQHYNITEVFSRKLRKTLLNTTFTKNNIEVVLNKICFSTYKELVAFQAEYDNSVYSKPLKQKEWNKKVENLLNEYAQYQDINLSFHLSN